MASKSDCGSGLAWRRRDHADPIRKPCGGAGKPSKSVELLREPERSRHVLRLLCANYLAQRGNPRAPAPRRPAVWAVFIYLTTTNPITKGKLSIPLYPVDPEAPAGARALRLPRCGRLAGRDPRRQAATDRGI